jgi:signal transduction histidine kinase
MKHAANAPPRVTLQYGDRELSLEVVDEGPGPTASDGAGHGLVGMRERIAVYGGTLDYGPVNGRGFRVAARLPVREEALRD